jgi:hypothetical protein
MKFEIRTLENTTEIGENVFDNYPVLIHDTNIIETRNIKRYLKKISVLYKPE